MTNMYDDNQNTIFVSSNDNKATSKEKNDTHSSNTSVPYKSIIIALCLVCIFVAIIMFCIGRTSGERGSNLELARLKSEVTDLRDKNRASEVIIDNYKKQLYELENSTTTSEEKNKLDNEIAELKEQVESLSNSNKELNEKVKANEKLAEEKKKVDDEVVSLKTQVQNLTKTNKELNNKIKNLEQNTNVNKASSNTVNNQQSSTGTTANDIVSVTNVSVKAVPYTSNSAYDLTISGTINSNRPIKSVNFTVEALNSNGEILSLADKSYYYVGGSNDLVNYSSTKIVTLQNPSSTGNFSFTWSGALLNKTVSQARVTNIKINY